MRIYEILKEEYLNKKVKGDDGNIYKIRKFENGEYFLRSLLGEVMVLTSSLLNAEFELVVESEWYDIETIKENDKYYYVSGYGDLGEYTYIGEYISVNMLDNLTFFKTQEKALEVQDEQLLYRKMKKFQEENDKEVNWEDGSAKYALSFDCFGEKWYVSSVYCSKDIGVIYFTSEKLAERCLNEIVIPHKK